MSRGGIRSGAGRPRYRLHQSDCLRIDQRWLRYASDWVRHGFSVRGEQVIASKNLQRLRDAPISHVTIEARGMMQDVSVQYTHQGRRWWFECPYCGARRRDLYLAPRDVSWKCRTCLQLVYETDCLPRLDRMLHRREKIEEQLMRCGPWAHKKRARLATLYERLDAKIDGLLGGMIMRHLDRLPPDEIDDALAALPIKSARQSDRTKAPSLDLRMARTGRDLRVGVVMGKGCEEMQKATRVVGQMLDPGSRIKRQALRTSS